MGLLPVSVIVPTRGQGSCLDAAIASLIKSDVHEILIVSKTRIDPTAFDYDRRIRILTRPEAGLSEARNIGISESCNGLIAFTDDDCTAPSDWPRAALELFRDPNVGAAGGPGITHPDGSWREKCSGAVLCSRIGAADSAYRYRPVSDQPKDVGEKQLSTCNLLFRKSILEKLGYFHTSLETCEENELIERIRSAGYRVLYSPRCIVYHHRRPLFTSFLRQIWGYGKGRAAFVIRFVEHLNPISIAPSILVLATVGLPLLWVIRNQLAIFLLTALAFYAFAIAMAALISSRRNSLRLELVPAIFLGMAAMHYCYGLSFIIGLFRPTKAQTLVSREERPRELKTIQSPTERGTNRMQGGRSIFRGK